MSSNKRAHTDIVILAAGAATRFGSPKQLALLHDRPLLQRAIDSSLLLPSCRVSVVLGAHEKLIKDKIDFKSATVIHNAQWTEGMASSIRTAVKTLSDDSNAILFVAADQVLLNAASLSQILNTWRQFPTSIVSAYYQGSAGIPALFPYSFFSALLSLEGDAGAKRLIKKYIHQVKPVHLDEAACDIDTPAQLSALMP